MPSLLPEKEQSRVRHVERQLQQELLSLLGSGTSHNGRVALLEGGQIPPLHSKPSTNSALPQSAQGSENNIPVSGHSHL